MNRQEQRTDRPVNPDKSDITDVIGSVGYARRVPEWVRRALTRSLPVKDFTAKARFGADAA